MAEDKKTLLDLARELHGISMSGLTYCKDPFDAERYRHLAVIAAEIIANHSVHSKEFMGTVFSAESGYTTPKLDVRAAVFKDNRILMVKERESGAWTLPGGYVDVNETLSRAAEREVAEEAGYKVRARKVAGVFDHRQHGYKPHLYHFFKFYVLCDLTGITEKSGLETDEVSFFDKAGLSRIELDVGRVVLKHILRMFDHHDSPNLPTDFD